jgi:hypothetical protein
VGLVLGVGKWVLANWLTGRFTDGVDIGKCIFWVIKTGSKKGRKGTQSGERNEQGNNPKTPIGSVFQGMLKGFVWGGFGGGFLVGSVSVFCFFRLWRFIFCAPFFTCFSRRAGRFCFLRPFLFFTLAQQAFFIGVAFRHSYFLRPFLFSSFSRLCRELF